jgi:uncharacterized protein (DUF305 family)
MKENAMLKPALAALAILLAVAPASAQTEMSHGNQMMMMMKMQGGKSPSQADKDYMAAMEKMNEAMTTTEMTGDPTGDFVRMMIPHHQSAIDMAEALLKQDKVDPKIKSIAKDIIRSQKKEIEAFQKWLKEHKS